MDRRPPFPTAFQFCGPLTQRIFLILVLGFSLLFPLFSGYGDAINNRLNGSPLAEATSSPLVSDCSLVAATIFLPILLDAIIDAFFEETLGTSHVERTTVLFFVESTSVVLFFVAYMDMKALAYCCCFAFQVWTIIAITLAVLHNLDASFFTPRLACSLACLAYATNLTAILHISFDNEAVAYIAIILRYACLISFFLVSILYLAQKTRPFLTSSHSFLTQFESLPESARYALLVVFTSFLAVISYATLLFISDAASSFRNLSSLFFICYYLLLTAAAFLITLLPQRLIKIRSHQLQYTLDTKKTFIR